MKTLVLAIGSFLVGFTSFAQAEEASTIFIARPKNFNGSLVNMRLEVNGEKVLLPRNSFIELAVKDSDVNIKSVHKRFAKFSTPHSSSIKQGQYFLAYFSVLNVKGWPKDIVVIKQISKECYAESIRGCTDAKLQMK